jgi:hypothetical protein
MSPDVVVTVTVIVDVPAATPVTSPVLFTVATVVVPDVHATWLVRSFVVLSANVPVAFNCVVDPVATVGLLGVIASELSACGFTITLPVALTPSCDAVIVALPAVDPAVTSPVVFTVAEPEAEVVHFAELDTSLVVPSTVVPLALNCFVSPDFRKIEVGVTVMLFSAPPPTKNPLQLLRTSAEVSTRARSTWLVIGRRADCMLHLCANSTKITYSAPWHGTGWPMRAVVARVGSSHELGPLFSPM